MTIEEAKTILAATHPDGAQPRDAEVEQALKLAETEPELAAWLAEQAAFDAAFSKALDDIEPPAGLKEKLLALEPVSPGLAQDDKVISLPAPWWKSKGLLSAAATVAILFGFAAILLKPTDVQADQSLESFQDIMADHFRGDPKLFVTSDDLDEIRADLAKNDRPVPGDLPDKVDALLELGYGSLEYQGYPVVYISMHNGDIYRLYLVEEACFEHAPEMDKPQIVADEELALMTWTDDGNVYVLILRGSVEELSELL